MKLQVKASLFLSGLLLAVLLGQGVLFTFYLERSLQDSSHQNLMDHAQLVANRLDAYIITAQSEILNIAQNLNIQSLLNGKIKDIEPFLQSASISNAHFDNGFFVLDSKGNLIVDYPVSDKRGENFAFRDYFKKTLTEKKPIISSPYQSKRSGAMVITFTAPLVSYEGTFWGLLGGSTNLFRYNFAGGLRELHIGQTGEIILYNSSRTILFHSNPDLMTKEGEPAKSDPILQDLPLKSNIVLERRALDGSKVDIALYRLQTTDWIVGVMQKEEEVLAPLSSLKKQIIFFLIPALVVAIGIGIWGMGILSKPINALSKSIKPYQGGDWEEPANLISRGDEIGELGQSFKNMTALLGTTLNSLRESEMKYRALIQESLVGVFLIHERRFVFVNPRFAEIFGYNQEEIINSIDPLDLVAQQDRDQVLTILTQPLPENNRQVHFFWKGLRKDGSLIEVEVMGSPLLYQGKPAIHGTLLDITDRKQAEEALKALSFKDELTDLYNRRGFFALAEQGLRTGQRLGSKMLLIYGDLDNFKKINDTYGHQAGDQALTDISHILKETFRESDIIARIGGDEFVILAMNNSEDSGEKLIARFEKILHNHPVQTSRPYILSISLGVVDINPKIPESIDSLLTQADRMMYENKQKRQTKL